MDAGPSSAPVLHEMQPPVRTPAPRSRVPGAPPTGALRPPVRTGQRQGPVISMPPKAPIPPPTFRFQTIKRPAAPSVNKTPSKPLTPLPPLPARQPIPYNKPRAPAKTPQFHSPQNKRTPHNNNGRMGFNGSSNHANHPSTSFSEQNSPRKQPPPAFRLPPRNTSNNVPDFNDGEVIPNGHVDSEPTLNVVDKSQTTIELPPNCKLFQYSCEVGGVMRTLLVPMPSNATEEDVMKMLPESFNEIAANIFEKEIDMTPEELPRLSIPNEPREEPTLVNPKQFFRIQKRRDMRQRLEMSGRLPLQRQKYLHESRHRHAISRKRGVDGRFDPKLRAEEQESSPTSSGPTYRAQPLTRPARTYAAIRPANDMARVPSATVRRLEPVRNPSGPSTSMQSSSGHTYYTHEPITSFQQYQQHVQYTDTRHYQSSSSVGTSNGETSSGGQTTANEPTATDATPNQQDFTNL